VCVCTCMSTGYRNCSWRKEDAVACYCLRWSSSASQFSCCIPRKTGPSTHL